MILFDRLMALPGRYKQLLVAAIDAVLAIATLWIALSLRYESFFVPFTWQHYVIFVISPLLAVPIFAKCGLYRAIFRYSSIGATAATIRAVVLYALAFGLVMLVMGRLVAHLPRTVAAIQPVMFAWAVLSIRAGLGMFLAAVRHEPGSNRMRERLMIFGAGVSGIQTAAALRASRAYRVVGFIDDSPVKIGRQIMGLDVCCRAEAEQMLRDREVDSVLLALPNISRIERNAIVEWLRPFGAHVRSIPSVVEIATGRVTFSDIRELDIEDLLGRAPVPQSLDRVEAEIAGGVVVVTGAGGSIGSELCRQLVRARPSKLLLVEQSEVSLYSIHKELSGLCEQLNGTVELVPLICDVRNSARLEEIFKAWRPSNIYHAAAYKHVPLVEHNVAEGVANNVLGTINVAQAAIRVGARRFVLISTDKAVRPTNVMGATKRLAEVALQAMAAEPRLSFSPGEREIDNRTVLAMVRFGNVLGSSGSVVPLFRSQLAAGGPLTVTHEDVTRYFMTIPEAAQLVLEAGAYATGGEVFLLDMGEPVRIIDLARRVIELSGATVRDARNPEGDIEIAITGLRPGEKLYEELLIDDTSMATQHPRIMRARERTWPWGAFLDRLGELRASIAQNDVKTMRLILSQFVDGFAANGDIVDLINVERAPGGDTPHAHPASSIAAL